MKFLDVLAPAPSGVGALCARKRLRRSRCERCVTRCPTGALGWRDGALTLLAERCTGCGICLFVCPSDALENLAPLQRHYHDGVLLGPFTLPVAVEELLLWHTHYGIRAVAVDLSQSPHWLRALGELNLRLRERGEPGWQCVPVNPMPGGAKRRLLRAQGERGRVPHDLAARRAAGALCNAGSATLDTTRCLLCGACEKACAAGSIRFSEQALTLDPARCTGCGDCAAVCPADAVRMDAGDTGAAIRYTLYHARCAQCGEPWRAWQQGETRCPLCRRHGFGMRGG
ncbi:4Fe-4S binding protein [Cronobacter dublinensis]|uniref:4Fe-4S binding protein n=1 Tax=Cronobacter dublinensis TaxID=413497 RepID=UPI001F40F531|nr:4Fe-4S binding protein [Cronobacter dublinensis]MDK1193664.1 4Fe-4S binding protein [Cronobacter dublinensis]MDK1200155.1 4Fe-4S binding protein [Cronobacter dublinensis]